MARAKLRRKINKAKAQKRSAKFTAVTPVSTVSAPQNQAIFDDEGGFRLVLTKKEKALMKKAHMDECAEEMPAANQGDVEMEPSAGNHVEVYSDTESLSDGLGAQSTVVSKSWVRKQLKQTHAGGISKPSCKKRQRDMFRRVLLHTQLHLHGKPNARGMAANASELVGVGGSGGGVGATDSSTGNTTVNPVTRSTVDCTDFVSQWAQFSQPVELDKTLVKRRKKKTKRKGKKSEPCSDVPASVVAFKSRATATQHAIHSFQTMLQKF